MYSPKSSAAFDRQKLWTATRFSQPRNHEIGQPELKSSQPALSNLGSVCTSTMTQRGKPPKSRLEWATLRSCLAEVRQHRTLHIQNDLLPTHCASYCAPKIQQLSEVWSKCQTSATSSGSTSPCTSRRMCSRGCAALRVVLVTVPRRLGNSPKSGRSQALLSTVGSC